MCLRVCSFLPFLFVAVVLNVSFAEVRLSRKEGSGFVEVVLLKDEGAVGPVSVLLSTQDGTATGESS